MNKKLLAVAVLAAAGLVVSAWAAPPVVASAKLKGAESTAFNTKMAQAIDKKAVDDVRNYATIDDKQTGGQGGVLIAKTTYGAGGALAFKSDSTGKSDIGMQPERASTTSTVDTAVTVASVSIQGIYMSSAFAPGNTVLIGAPDKANYDVQRTSAAGLGNDAAKNNNFTFNIDAIGAGGSKNAPA